MILIADSGSTKCDWALVSSDFEKRGYYRSMGLNPYFHTPEVIERALRDNAELASLAEEITHVFFYGAGSSSPKLCAIMEAGLARVFCNARILVDHDLVGAAYSTYSGEPSISCILGTGSNSVFFDGTGIYEEVPSLAYIVGDEASGSYYGKDLLRAYFYKRLPKELRDAFERDYAPTKDEFVDRVYNQPDANVYLASFMKFLGDQYEHPWCKELIKKGQRDFLEVHVKCYPNWAEVPVHFVGSGAYHFRKELGEVCAEMGIRLGNIIRRPIDGLVAYHKQYKQEEINA
ncbi:MAG: hypothetical protein ACON34_09495 [Flavobacteriales bacterium]